MPGMMESCGRRWVSGWPDGMEGVSEQTLIARDAGEEPLVRQRIDSRCRSPVRQDGDSWSSSLALACPWNAVACKRSWGTSARAPSSFP